MKLIKIAPQPILMILIMFLLTLKVINIKFTAKQAEIKIENSDVMFLKMLWLLFLLKIQTIKITSDFGKYNSKNYDTIFSENVIIIYPGHKITGEYLDFSFLNNFGTFTKMLFILEKKQIYLLIKLK